MSVINAILITAKYVYVFHDNHKPIFFQFIVEPNYVKL